MIPPGPFVLLWILWGLIFLTLVWFAAKYGRGRRPDEARYETDLRLTYKRFKELYPYSEITYPEYKRLQAEKAYKRAVGSEKIKRMVR